MGKTLVQRAVVRTNSIKDSVCTIQVEALKFKDLWANYPSSPPYVDPKTGKVPAGYSNQCAIKVSVAIHGAGIEMKSFTPKVIGVDAKHFGMVTINGKNTATLASQLAMWLKLQPFCGLPQKPENITGTDWETKIKARTGIVYFADYWARNTGEKARPTGDHIDLWNGGRLTAVGASALSTMGRMIGMNSFFPGTRYGYSDLRASREILFWEVK